MGEHGIIKTLGRSAIMYSACSSFAALSGNSDLQLHSAIQPEQDEEEEMEEGNAKDVDSNSTKSESDEESDDELESEDEEDDVEYHREPINHLLKVKLLFDVSYNSIYFSMPLFI